MCLERLESYKLNKNIKIILNKTICSEWDLEEKKVQFLGQIVHKIICEMISNYPERDIVIKHKGHQFYGPLESFS